jgi:hypothetical protein
LLTRRPVELALNLVKKSVLASVDEGLELLVLVFAEVVLLLQLVEYILNVQNLSLVKDNLIFGHLKIFIVLIGNVAHDTETSLECA